ncbi:hypothetical protein [Granulosicoccus antarcticus]|uniref:Uncharacterized protein n=1 Tax=Granulosicoccus antarcticus IMCC3135 TaxID=1192854 RepID=A0A2Z2NX22_9GAMM|nr:hypothetical protein [Granulosicoccus antarcticus]ASJ72287.1 hypothetical protein IMCC3135_10975 [Granulosicoccus antarcticus IMCC3135]
MNLSDITIDWPRISGFVLAAVASCVAGWYGQPLVHGNAEASRIIVNVFSIMAGVLITIMTLLGEPSLYRGRNWRADAVRRSNVYRRLVRQKILFVLYLVTLVLVFLSSLFKGEYSSLAVLRYIEIAYLSCACMAFILSMNLPGRLTSLQLARFDEMVEARRKAEKPRKEEG